MRPCRFMHHQRWSDALFLHYEVDADELQQLLPPGLLIDLYEGKAYVGVIALSEEGIGPAGVLAPPLLRPLLRLLQVSHHAVNVRTYVRPEGGGPPGIFFFSLDCSHALPSIGARVLFNLPYCLARMRRSHAGSSTTRSYRLSSRRLGSSAEFDAEWAGASELPQQAPAGSLAAFVAERYCLYNTCGLVLRLLLLPWARATHTVALWRGTITHEPWPLQPARVTIHRDTMVETVIGLKPLSDVPVAHCSHPGVDSVDFYFEPMAPAKAL